MNLTVHKYQLAFGPLGVVVEIMMPRGAEILTVNVQSDIICIWARVDTHEPYEGRRFCITATGTPCPPDKYVGTVLMHDGNFIFHVFLQDSKEAA